MKHRPRNKEIYLRHVKHLIDKGFTMKSILTIRRLLAKGFWYNEKMKPL